MLMALLLALIFLPLFWTVYTAHEHGLQGSSAGQL